MAQNDDFYMEILEEAREVVNELGMPYKLIFEGAYDYKEMETADSTSVDCLAVQTSWATTLENNSWGSKEVYVIICDVPVTEGMRLANADGEVLAVLTNVETVKPADVTIIYIAEFET